MYCKTGDKKKKTGYSAILPMFFQQPGIIVMKMEAEISLYMNPISNDNRTGYTVQYI
jgi:hypothetical protein